MADESALEKAPWLSLLGSRAGKGLLIEAFPRWTAVALTLAVAAVLATVAIAEAAAVTIAKAETAIVALAVAVDLAHHRGGTFLVLVHANREVAQHVLAEPLLPLDLVEGGRRRVDIEQGKMCLAVLTQTVGEGLHAPLLGLGDLAPHLLDDGLELGGQFFDLLRAGVLAREEDVFVERHRMPFPCSLLHPARSPSSHFGKGSSAQKAGTRDAGPSALPPGIGQAAVRSVPSRDRAEARVIGSPREKARRFGTAQVRRQPPLGLTGRMSRCLRARCH